MEKSIVSAFKDSIENQNVRELAVQGADTTFDMFVNTGDLSGVPVFGLLNSGVKIVKDYNKYRLAKKIYSFIGSPA